MKSKRSAWIAMAFFALTYLSPALAVNPWSGYWWPLSAGELIFGYNSDVPPLQKYDALVYGTYPGPATQESYDRKLNYDTGAGSWFGLCNGWAAAAIMTKEPTQASTVQGIRFNVGDQKGLLSEAWYNTTSDGWFAGSRYYGYGDDYQDLYPDQFWRLLQVYLRDNGIAFVADIAAGEEVWNYPIQSYSLQGQHVGGGWYDCTLDIGLADDAVHPDFVGIKEIAKSYTFMVQLNSGNIVDGSGYWTGSSVQDHPDFAWYPGSQPVLRNSKLNYQTIQTICSGGGGTASAPRPMIFANGSADGITIWKGDPLAISISLEPNGWQNQTVDWWVLANAYGRWFSYVYPYGWYQGVYPMIQYPLFALNGYTVLYDQGGLDWGDYDFYFVVDGNADGRLDATWYDGIRVTIGGIIINDEEEDTDGED
jgi:hypothetical protein